MFKNPKPPLPKKPTYCRSGQNSPFPQIKLPSVTQFHESSGENSKTPFIQKQTSILSLKKPAQRYNTPISEMKTLKTLKHQKSKMNGTMFSRSPSRMGTKTVISSQNKQVSKETLKKNALITQLLSKHGEVNPNSPIFNIPNSVILKSKEWSLSNDKLAEVNINQTTYKSSYPQFEFFSKSFCLDKSGSNIRLPYGNCQKRK